MSKPAIEVKNLSKSYVISHQKEAKKHSSLGTLVNTLKKPLGGGPGYSKETFWALKDVSFEIPQGEVFGILGKNGSGKSTLLKLLSRIVDPTEGEIKIRGRIASLLEVGTGFHPELTGRENVFLNGSMLGLSRQEIISKFNQIVEFSEVERFLDTPVKFYSSGMYVRLAFSVAAHLEPDVLILDEVLSVGDAAFQKKSLNKILETMRSGCTVLMVSHSAENIRTLCKNGILLDSGNVASVGDIDKVLIEYKKAQIAQMPGGTSDLREVVVQYSKLLSNTENLNVESKLKAVVEFTALTQLDRSTVHFYIEDSTGRIVLHTKTNDRKNYSSFKAGDHKVTITVPRLSLNKGTYSCWFRIAAVIGESGKSEYVVDTERKSFEVKGPENVSSATVDVPSSWEYK